MAIDRSTPRSGASLLLFSDLHRDTAAASRLLSMAEQADILIGAGDFADARRGIGDCIDVLRHAHRPAVLVPGNNESTEELRDACRNWPEAHVLHGSSCILQGITFYGVGGGIPVTPFGSWSYDFTEAQARTLLEGCPSGAILIAHSPPRGVLDVSSSGAHLGSEAIREAALRLRPRLVVCGHIHASGGQSAELEGVPVVNAGPRGVRFELILPA